MNKICVRYLVSGRVQGVFFRASTRYQAQSLGISGYARNLADGRVEVLACGESKALDQLRTWLVKGPGVRIAQYITNMEIGPRLRLTRQIALMAWSILTIIITATTTRNPNPIPLSLAALLLNSIR